ncbi:MAG: hypothetical protein PUE96_06180, partial [Oscillospiraceae bacterium]|nr:hypothetical protein [Oscillospiraceae bacterium]
QLVEKVFSTSCLRFQNFQKVLKSIDLNGAGHPSWVPRAHPSFPFSYISGFIDSLTRRTERRALFFIQKQAGDIFRKFPAAFPTGNSPVFGQNGIQTALVGTHKNFSIFSRFYHSHIHILCSIMKPLQ